MKIYKLKFKGNYNNPTKYNNLELGITVKINECVDVSEKIYERLTKNKSTKTWEVISKKEERDPSLERMIRTDTPEDYKKKEEVLYVPEPPATRDIAEGVGVVEKEEKPKKRKRFKKTF